MLVLRVWASSLSPMQAGGSQHPDNHRLMCSQTTPENQSVSHYSALSFQPTRHTGAPVLPVSSSLLTASQAPALWRSHVPAAHLTLPPPRFALRYPTCTSFLLPGVSQQQKRCSTRAVCRERPEGTLSGHRGYDQPCPAAPGCVTAEGLLSLPRSLRVCLSHITAGPVPRPACSCRGFWRGCALPCPAAAAH